VSLTVGLCAVFISLTIGILIGLIGGYFGGKTDAALMLFVNTIWSIPTLLLVFAIVLALGRGMHILYLAIGLTLWVDVARLVRGQVIQTKENVYIEAAKSLGFQSQRIMFKHILPNILGPIIVVATGNFATAIILEAGLSYLGFGVQPPMPSWGSMLNENYGYALSGNYYLAVIPALAIVLLVLSVNILGNSIRDYYDVKIDK
jgi:peptide/nickel transport system permease protein